MTKVVDAVVDKDVAADNRGIGLRMKTAREHFRLTQEELGKAVGASKRGIQENEARNRVPGADVVAGFVRLGINANWLLIGEGPMLLAELITPTTAPVVQKINVDALVQAFCVSVQTAPKSETLEQSARKAVAFYEYCLDRGMITPDGEGEGVRESAA